MVPQAHFQVQYHPAYLLPRVTPVGQVNPFPALNVSYHGLSTALLMGLEGVLLAVWLFMHYHLEVTSQNEHFWLA